MNGAWGEIRRRARDWHATVLAVADGDCSARALVTGASAITGIGCFGVPRSDALLDGGDAALDTEAQAIWYRNDIEPGLALYYQAHEFAHLWLDDQRSLCDSADLAPDGGARPPAIGVHRVEGYGRRERRERRANVFAGEFLLPAPLLRRWFSAGDDARAIARRTGLPEGLVSHHLARALLVPEAQPEARAEPPLPPRGLDPSQQRAAFAAQGPLLVDAGPGTGKTRTLTARVEHLLTSGCAPTSILALTFSNRAAEEMRQRVARTAPAAAPDIWMGTFHAFGLELLRKFGHLVGLSPDLAVLDPTDALELLEEELPALRLDHYHNLYEPTIQLRDVLGAVSRAKDEHVGPRAYADLARAMAERATKDEDRTKAAKAQEVAHVYAVYEKRLRAQGAVDYGDLISRSIDLLRAHPHVAREVRARYEHVLVDEYQDINRASSLLLREIAPDGRGLWVVGDARQAIYRFRGAAPANMALFERDFPGAMTLALETNYRSRPAIVAAVAALAPQMRASRRHASFSAWQCDRAEMVGEIKLEIATDLDAECAGVAEEIRRHYASGIRYRDQAVLCRSHTQLARVAARLEAAGVPVFYLGDLFERPEVRDLLCVVALASEPSGAALHRVGGFPEYGIPTSDVQALLAYARDHDERFPEALRLAGSVAGISDQGRRSLERLAAHLDAFHFGTTPWTLLSEYLFVRSRYLAAALDGSLAGQQRGLAIHQLLQVAYEARRRKRAPNEDPKRAFLEHIRRLELFGDEKALREIPEDADDLDAVRLSTVHASKGLEFRAVYLPGLGQGRFPARCKPVTCPPPDGLLGDDVADAHDEEEECLFFVGLSRARDALCLSRAGRYGAVNSNASSLLGLIAARLPRSASGPATWTVAKSTTSPTPAPPAPPAGEGRTYDAVDLDTYLECPRQYYYRHVLALAGRSKPAYVQFHQSVFDVMRWLRERASAGESVDLPAALGRLSEVWQERGLGAHVYAAFYREQAERMVARLVATAARGGTAAGAPAPWQVELTHGRVVFTPDHVERHASGEETVVRFRTGRVSKSESDKPVYTLLHVGGVAGEPQPRRRVQVVSLSTDATREVSPSAAVRTRVLAKYDGAMHDIAAGHFPANPDERRCPNCAHYFLCPAPQPADESSGA